MFFVNDGMHLSNDKASVGPPKCRVFKSNYKTFWTNHKVMGSNQIEAEVFNLTTPVCLHIR